MHIRIKILNDDVREWYENHAHHHPGDSGLDLFCPERLSLDPMETGFIDFGIAIECFGDDSCTKNVSCWLLLRSSTGKKTPIRMSNGIEMIDSGYRGPLGGCIDNFTKPEYYDNSIPADEDSTYLTATEHYNPYIIEEGSRLFQLASPTLDPITFEIVDELSDTSRGEGGFGSTGV